MVSCNFFSSVSASLQRRRGTKWQRAGRSTGSEKQRASTSDGSSTETARSSRHTGHGPSKYLPDHVRYTIGFDSVVKKTQPVHETLTLAALYLADPSRYAGTSYSNADPETWEIFRGAMWNDDPCCDLFDDGDGTDNHHFSTGFSFGARFGAAKAEAELATALRWPLRVLRHGSLTARSHFYDLQFLHGMATVAGEEAAATKAKILLWCQTMYRLAAAADVGVRADTAIRDLSVVSGPYRLHHFFDDNTHPTADASLFCLLTNDTTYRGVQIERRALGSLLHVIQDSYARGHVRRDDTAEGAAGPRTENSGRVRTFHCYLGQSARKHARYDEMDVAHVSPADLDAFDGMPGARAAIEACAQVVRFWMARRPWKGEVEDFISETVFRLSPEVTSSNTDV